MRPSSLVMMALLLAAACSALQAAPLDPNSACINKCWNRYTAEINDCVDKADMSKALETKPGAAGAAAPAMGYNGPKVDVLQAVRSQCYSNVGTDKVNACILACDDPPVVDPAPADCELICRIKYKPQTLGRLKCMYNC
jgi:hypothetical protein